MATKKKNERCPLQGECEKVCTFTYHERDCEYYQGNNRPGAEIQDQVEAAERELEERELEQLADAGNMVSIPIGRLSPHPDNPRKDLGDLSELADSIKENGILQNLTVVKRLGEITGTFGGNYTVVIGHRRLAAAKLAGLKEVPCVVVDMPLQDQVRTMLMENIQRADLTVYEQAQGFQLMLNLGDSVDDIARKSGFSQTTVRRRVKLLELDQDKFKESVSRGATLQDYMELDKISDPDLKNEVLDAIGTNNFRNRLQNAIEQEKQKKYAEEAIAMLSWFATQVEEIDYQKLQYIRNFSYWNRTSPFEKPDDTDTRSYYYKVSRSQIDLYADKVEQTVDSAAEEERARAKEDLERRRSELKDATKRAYELRCDFAESVSSKTAKDFLPEIVAFSLFTSLDAQTDLDMDDVLNMLGIEPADEESDDESENELGYDMVVESVRKAPERILWEMTYRLSDDDCTNGYYQYWNAGHDDNPDLDRLYALLEKMGYEMSDEEKQLQDGSHELFPEVEE